MLDKEQNSEDYEKSKIKLQLLAQKAEILNLVAPKNGVSNNFE
jgi:hypothetical protein